MCYFKAAVGFHVQFAKFFYSVNIELIIDSGGFIAAANIVIIAERFADNLFTLLTGCVFY